MNEQDEMSKGEFDECMNIAKVFQLSNRVNEQLIQLAKNTWLWSDSTYVSSADMASLLDMGLSQRSFTVNAVKKNRVNTTTNGLKYKVLPELIEVGMITKDTTGRYDQYTVEKTGMEFLLWHQLRCNSCNHTGICGECKGKGLCDGDKLCEKCSDPTSEKCWYDGKCSRCETGQCHRCEDTMKKIGGHDKLVAMIQYINS